VTPNIKQVLPFGIDTATTVARVAAGGL